MVLQQQTGLWNICLPAFGILIFLILARPYAEAENELIGGYHTEYSSMSTVLSFLRIYKYVEQCYNGNLIFGGYDIPF